MITMDLTPVAHPHSECGRSHPLGPCPWATGDRVEARLYGRGTVMEDHAGHGVVRVALDSGAALTLHVSMERLCYAADGSGAEFRRIRGAR